eukprot:TRINITY_DN662_c2_g1_i2.p1 TRINITY_DN662_c2_g1~~TRINITY_DN662_c2_g1_i2.p1  ORF type:complete len:328 (-),score=44.09 TRINITY_DN662_c2_g1_i2:197-1180(-)
MSTTPMRTLGPPLNPSLGTPAPQPCSIPATVVSFSQRRVQCCVADLRKQVDHYEKCVSSSHDTFSDLVRFIQEMKYVASDHWGGLSTLVSSASNASSFHKPSSLYASTYSGHLLAQADGLIVWSDDTDDSEDSTKLLPKTPTAPSTPVLGCVFRSLREETLSQLVDSMEEAFVRLFSSIERLEHSYSIMSGCVCDIDNVVTTMENAILTKWGFLGPSHVPLSSPSNYGTHFLVLYGTLPATEFGLSSRRILSFYAQDLWMKRTLALELKSIAHLLSSSCTTSSEDNSSRECLSMYSSSWALCPMVDDVAVRYELDRMDADISSRHGL